VIPSLTEGFPLCLAEAMAAENAIVATEVGGMKEIGVDGETVLFVPPEDPQSIAEKILHLMKSNDFAVTIAEKAKNYSKSFSIKNSVKLLEDEYEKVYTSVR
jgi:glycosyltransferase involved in cell wall biosynthesis